jgi:hypothetical protein
VPLFGVIFLLVAGSWLAKVAYSQPGKASVGEREPGKKPDDAQNKFDALKKQLPDILSPWSKSACLLEPKVRIARMTSPAEAKITVVGIAALSNGSACSFSFYLQYYDGAWTVIRWEAGGTEIDHDKVGTYMLTLSLAIDESAGKSQQDDQP